MPIASKPAWCADGLCFPENAKIVVLDDDESIHMLWRQKLENLEVKFLKNPEEFDTQPYPPESHFYILDYEIAGSTLTGLDLIRSFHLGARAILVTVQGAIRLWVRASIDAHPIFSFALPC